MWIDDKPMMDGLENIKSSIPSTITLYYQYDLRNHALFINRLQIPKNQQQKGLGSQIMTQLTKWADQYQQLILLMPTDSLGSDLQRLIRFYQRFGFQKYGEEARIVYETGLCNYVIDQYYIRGYSDD